MQIIVETCEELRSMSPQGLLSSYTTVPGKYSFIHKVIDGITVSINTVHVTFNSPAFTANVQVILKTMHSIISYKHFNF